jgi:hypothetical protein
MLTYLPAVGIYAPVKQATENNQTESYYLSNKLFVTLGGDKGGIVRVRFMIAIHYFKKSSK